MRNSDDLEGTTQSRNDGANLNIARWARTKRHANCPVVRVPNHLRFELAGTPVRRFVVDKGVNCDALYIEGPTTHGSHKRCHLPVCTCARTTAQHEGLIETIRKWQGRFSLLLSKTEANKWQLHK